MPKPDAAPAVPIAPAKRRGRPPGSTNKKPVLKSPSDISGSPEAKRTAAVILEVLAGLRLTSEAALALEISEGCYYAVEARALQGLVAACEPRRAGPPAPSPEQELESLKKDKARLEREHARLAALVRATQRTVGLAAPPAEQTLATGEKRKRRRPVVRALVASEALRKEEPPAQQMPPAQPETPIEW
jgi:hypothetical protein